MTAQFTREPNLLYHNATADAQCHNNNNNHHQTIAAAAAAAGVLLNAIYDSLESTTLPFSTAAESLLVHLQAIVNRQ